MKQLFWLLPFIISCTSKTIYKTPDNLIPKDTMILLLEDLYIANTAKNYININSERNIDYSSLIYSKYKIDTLRFKTSNIYYTSKVEDYHEIVKEVKKRLDAKIKVYEKKDTLKVLDKLKEELVQ